MKQSHRDLLISALPADMQAEVLKVCQAHSTDGNDIVEALFAANLETGKRGIENILNEFSRVHERLAIFEQQEKQRDDQHAKDRTETQKSIKGELQNLTGDKPWRRGIIKSIVNGIVWTISVVASTVGIVLILLKTEISPLREVIGKHQKIAKILADDPASLMEFARHTKDANSEALRTAESLQVISKLMAIPKMQIYRGDDGFLTIYADQTFMPVGTSKDGPNWFKLGNIQAMMSSDTTLSIDKARESQNKLGMK